MEEAEIRRLFPGASQRVYLNAAAQSLLPLPAAEAMEQVLRDQVQRGILAFGDDLERLQAARAAAARSISAEPDEIAFVQNTAEGIGRIAAGLDWRDGDEIVLGDLEYPANVYPWAAQCPRGARLKIVPSENGRIEAGRLLDAVGPKTRVLAVSHVQFTSGYRVDLEELGEGCRREGVLLLVDAIQSLGAVPVDVKRNGIGALAVDGRKWLMGPPASGFLYVAPEWVERIRPTVAGAISVRDPERFLQWCEHVEPDGRLDLEPLLRPGAGRFEAGFFNMIGAAGLGASLQFAERIGRDRIHRRIADRVERLVRGLAESGLPVYGPRNTAERAGIVTFEVPGNSDELFEKLNQGGISIAVRDGRLRASPHVYNTDEEVDRLLDQLDRSARG